MGLSALLLGTEAVVMSRNEAIQTLGLIEAEASSVQSVRSAFARAIRAAHPDTAQTDLESAVNIAKAQEAREVLLTAILEQKMSCKLCNGHGIVRGKVGYVQCVACGGTGEQR